MPYSDICNALISCLQETPSTIASNFGEQREREPPAQPRLLIRLPARTTGFRRETQSATIRIPALQTRVPREDARRRCRGSSGGIGSGDPDDLPREKNSPQEKARGGGGEEPGGAGGVRVVNGCKRGGKEARLTESESSTGVLDFDDADVPLETDSRPSAAKKAKTLRNSGVSKRKMQTLEILCSTNPSVEHLPLSAGPRYLFMALAHSCQQILETESSELHLALIAMMRALKGKEDPRTDVLSALGDNSLSNLVSRCYLAEANVVMHDFTYMISVIALVSAVQQ